jgi:poly(hydroxyalkanoate) depolymerase family esterase
MNALPKTDMLEATRLTREGRLAEAMAVLRRVLAGTPPSPVPSNFGSDARQGPTGLARAILDMAPPCAGPEAARTSPQVGKTHVAPRPESVSPPRIPEPLRGFLDRIGHPGFGRVGDKRVAPAVSRAPAPLPAGARFEERVYANKTGSRAYKLYIPSGYDGQALPLVLMLHGCTQSPDDFATGTRMNDLAEEGIFLVAYPEQIQSANPSKCWNWFNPDNQQRDQGEPSLIAGITRQIMRDYPINPRRVYIAGLSAGGAAAAIMGATYPDLYAGVGIHSGLACGAASDMPSAFAAMRQGASPVAARSRWPDRPKATLPTIVFHGDRDMTVNPVNADQIIAQSKARADLRTTISRGEAPGGISYTRTVQADESGRPMLEQWTLHGAGHAWSGGSAAGSYTEPRGPDASREMIRFFLHQQ